MNRLINSTIRNGLIFNSAMNRIIRKANTGLILVGPDQDNKQYLFDMIEQTSPKWRRHNNILTYDNKGFVLNLKSDNDIIQIIEELNNYTTDKLNGQYELYSILVNNNPDIIRNNSDIVDAKLWFKHSFINSCDRFRY